MWAGVSERRRWALIVLVAALLLAALDLWWVHTYRQGYPLSIDEAGYTSIALGDYFSLKSLGLHAWWDTIQATPIQAPLTPALTSLVMVVNEGIMQGFVVLAGFLVVLTMAVYGIADRIAGPRLGALAALVVVTSQGAFMFAHQFIFALPAAALLACSVYSLLRSEGMQRTRWALVCGVAIGLMLLARTMTVVFVPGIAAAALVALLTRPRQDWPIGALNLAGAAVAAFAVAATWYWRNLGSVRDYLTNYGYGSASSNYGASHSILSWAWWHDVASRMASSDLLIPLGAVVLAGLIAVAVEVVRRIARATDRRGEAFRMAGSDAFSIAVVFVAGYLALSTSRNAGFGFTFPLAVLLPPLAVIALRLHRGATVAVVSLLAAIAVVNVAANSNITEGLSRERSIHVPALGTIAWIDGVTNTLQSMREEQPGPETRFVGADRAWPRASDQLAHYIVDDLGTPLATPVTAFAPANALLNTSTVALASLQDYQAIRIPLVGLPDEGNDVAAYTRDLNDPGTGPPAVLITFRSNRGGNELQMGPGQAAVEEAARRSGFQLVRTMPLPNGTRLHVWKRRESPSTGL